MAERTVSMKLGGSGTALERVRLRVLEGPDRGREAALGDGVSVVGTAPDCQLLLTDPTVSRRHASFELRGGVVRVTDLRSKNATRYLGARIDTAELPIGSTVLVGKTRIAFLPAALPHSALSESTECEGMLGQSVAMRRLFAQAQRVGPTDSPVLLVGETGSGKGRLARALHALSARLAGPFQVLDCGSLAGGGALAALFGEGEGAGAIEAADQGTLFLDEVAAMPAQAQLGLLRALDTRSFVRLGEGGTRRSDFRAIAATHEDLERLAASGRFRADLYYRLAAIVLEVPPLRERLEDLPLLATAFAARARPGARPRFGPEVMAALFAHRWPGNVRELENVIERAATFGKAPLPERPSGEADFHEARERAMKAFERSYLEALLKEHGGPTAAAREARVARSYFYRLLEEHGLIRKKRAKKA
ncbi:MAG: sigma 54-dependent Fis family transcriptional regulator [Myxococcales bacterium]|nr:sigma 54-dependent Fis family transcriptional regulator [Myxococcales bacterium]